MQHSPADVVAQLLIDLELASNPDDGDAWPVNVASEPSEPSNAVTVYDTAGGRDGGRSMIDGELLGHLGFQVRVRAKDHKTGWTRAHAIQTALARSVRLTEVTVDETSYLVHAVAKIGDVLVLGKDTPQSKRNLFTINAVLAVKQRGTS